MKLTYEDKLEIYKLRKQGVSWPQLGQTYDVNLEIYVTWLSLWTDMA